MSIEKFNPRTVVLIVFMLIIGATRTYLSIDPNMFGLANFSALGAMALFGGVYFNKHWKALFFPLGSLFISDVIVQSTVHYKPGDGILYGGWYYVYGAFILMVAVGRFIKNESVKNILLGSVIVVVIHWLVTDIGVWYQNKIYSQDFAGYWQCLVMAIPFELRFLMGTLIYSGLFFGAFEWLQYKYPVLNKTNQTIAS
jgi:hypothetical protein